MAVNSLTEAEKGRFAELLGMGSGYVSNYSDGTFKDLIARTVNIDIDDSKYKNIGTSKAKRLRSFWNQENDYVVRKVLQVLLDGIRPELLNESQQKLIPLCQSTVNRLLATGFQASLNGVSEKIDTPYVSRQIRRMNDALLSGDIELAIGTAKELIETVCKTILEGNGIKFEPFEKIQDLTKKTLKCLNLLPDSVPDSSRGSDIIKELLRSMGTIGKNMSDLRNLYGTGHCQQGSRQVLQLRHARLAVGASSTFAMFLIETYEYLSSR